ncbi:MAG: hypothetical protein IJA60_04620 [Clostridia bacterium]|nr:hypothetical protein [Clostridia bacterium]
MRNLKKFLALVLAMMMVLSVAVISTSAADEADYTDAANHLAALQVMKGNEKGDLMLENGVTRYQAALFFVQALTGETDTAVWNATKKSAVFSDVPEYGTAIDHANGIGIVKGRGNGVFGYNDPIIYQDMLVMAVRALGYETEDMAYPFGFILAAQKLGLTENVAQVNYKAELTRGETAQIIWDMLNTYVAAIDPLTDKVLYPGEKGLTDAILSASGTEIDERVTLLEDSGLAGGKVAGVIVDFVEADEDDEESFDVVTVDIDEIGEVDLAAADFGITAETRKVNYMGLPVELFISVNEEDFNQTEYDDGEAEIVFASFPEYNTVVNLGDAGNIKYVANETAGKDYFSFGGEKFTSAKYDVVVAAFIDGIWTVVDDGEDLAELFAYDTRDGYVGLNTYAQVAYRVVDLDDTYEKDLVEVLYTPFSFGQYNVREVNGTKYTVVGQYNAVPAENLDEEESYFVEYLVDKIGTASAKVTSATKSISNSKGEAAATVVVEGEAVEAGDFMFYVYNPTDNVLTVAANAGTFETGRLTAHAPNSKTQTVKISGTNYEVGFKGVFAVDWASAEFNAEANKAYIAELEAGKDNVKYLVVDGNVVYMESCSEITNDSKFDFAIVTTDAEIMADLLDMTVTKYENALLEGLYVENGAVKVAMMDKATGEWVLASIDTYVQGWVAEDEEFENEYDIATDVKYTDLMDGYKNEAAVAAFADLVSCGLVAVIEEADGVYTVADNEADFFVYGVGEDGLLFSDNSPKTNAITADEDVDPARVTLDDESVIILVTAAGVGSRTGVQSAENSVDLEGVFLAASSDLIVFVSDDDAFDVADWADAATANSDENWYITTLTTGVEVEAGETEDDPYIITITNVYDMKAGEIVESIQTESEDIDAAMGIEGPGVVLFKNASDEIVVEERDFEDVIVEVANDNEDKLEYETLAIGTASGAKLFEFLDADTVVIDGVINKAEAVDVNVKVVTLDVTGLDPEDYDFEAVVSTREWNDETDTDNDYNVGDVEITVDNPETEEVETLLVWEYLLDNELVTEITEPTEGVLDQYIIDNID